mgnify:FL=1
MALVPPLTNSGQELLVPPALASSHSEKGWSTGYTLPQSRCRDGRRSHDRTSMEVLRRIQCSSFRQYPMLERLVKAAKASAAERPNIRRSPPGSPHSETEMQVTETVPRDVESRVDAHSDRSIDSLSTVQSFEIPDEGSEEEEERRVTDECQEITGPPFRTLRAWLGWRLW